MRKKSIVKKNSTPFGASGFSMIEVMMAGALLAFIAAAMMPSIYSMLDTNKVLSFRAQCQSFVKAKLMEYQSGVAANTAGAALTYTPNGFTYSKGRYQAIGQSTCETTATLSSPGFREYITNNKFVADTAAAETNHPLRMPGFQLYVMMKRYNPRTLTGGQPTRDCTTTEGANYGFFSLGDAIEVTVTGFIKTTTTVAQGGTGGKAWGKLLDISGIPNPQLTCSTTAVIYPPKLPFRYYLGSDSKIRNFQAGISFAGGAPATSQDAVESHFRTLWSQTPSAGTVDSGVLGNIRGFSISPDNKAAWLLRSGEIARYTCTDTNTVTVGGIAFTGVPDCTATPTTTFDVTTNSGTNFSTTSIDAITVDYKDLTLATDDVIYGMFGAGPGSAGEIRQLDISTPTTPKWIDTVGTFVFPNNPRIRSMFLVQTFPTVTSPAMYFMDNTCHENASGQLSTTASNRFSYCVSVFGSSDTGMNSDATVRELSSIVEGISY